MAGMRLWFEDGETRQQRLTAIYIGEDEVRKYTVEHTGTQRLPLAFSVVDATAFGAFCLLTLSPFVTSRGLQLASA